MNHHLDFWITLLPMLSSYALLNLPDTRTGTGGNQGPSSRLLQSSSVETIDKSWPFGFADRGSSGQSCASVPVGPLGPILGPDGRPLTQMVGLSMLPHVTPSSSTWNSPGAYPCPQCGKVYRWRGNLNLHLRQECGKAPQFQCPMCPHRSKQKSNLKTHIVNIHGPEVLRTAGMGQSHADRHN
ncbi:Longitudinals lacking protein, isoforms A/B/D/L [Frankliniella fusca]|uniref:Longitudinals lacking protein, isoforms A/B/D/L n=1 Tax=Frankliniella fusca TaxID=407009 RepID=A0AAE1H6G2_9NEOP|nr:Longitudinals lacking protein, isoforms A/B/D/L [Frankliniella fusca]